MSTQLNKTSLKPLGFIWIACPYPVASAGLTSFLKEEAQVYAGWEPPKDDTPSYVILGTNGEDVLEGIERVRKINPQALILVFSLHQEPSLAKAALKAGACGYIHARMTYEQIIGVLKAISGGVIVAPEVLREHLIADDEEPVNPNGLSARQREILELVGEGLTNVQIASHLFLTESTVKQHLRGAYKVLGVHNRTEALKIIRSDD